MQEVGERGWDSRGLVDFLVGGKLLCVNISSSSL